MADVLESSDGDRRLEPAPASTLRPRTLEFLRGQTRNFRLMLVRRTLHGVGTGLPGQYHSIYATALGADPVQLGSLRSVGSAVAAVASLPAGWLIDTHSLKHVFLVGTALMSISGVFFLTAPHGTYLYVAILLMSVGNRVSCTCCTVTCATELTNAQCP